MTIEFSLLIEHSPPWELMSLSSSLSSNHPAFCAPGSILSPSANYPSALPSSFLKRASARKPRAGGQEGCAQSTQVPLHPRGSAISKKSCLCFLGVARREGTWTCRGPPVDVLPEWAVSAPSRHCSGSERRLVLQEPSEAFMQTQPIWNFHRCIDIMGSVAPHWVSYVSFLPFTGPFTPFVHECCTRCLLCDSYHPSPPHSLPFENVNSRRANILPLLFTDQ